MRQQTKLIHTNTGNTQYKLERLELEGYEFHSIQGDYIIMQRPYPEEIKEDE